MKTTATVSLAITFDETRAEILRALKLKAEGKFPYVIGESTREHAGFVFAEELLEASEQLHAAALRVIRAINDGESDDKLRTELIQVAAISIQWASTL